MSNFTRTIPESSNHQIRVYQLFLTYNFLTKVENIAATCEDTESEVMEDDPLLDASFSVPNASTNPPLTGASRTPLFMRRDGLKSAFQIYNNTLVRAGRRHQDSGV